MEKRIDSLVQSGLILPISLYLSRHLGSFFPFSFFVRRFQAPRDDILQALILATAASGISYHCQCSSALENADIRCDICAYSREMYLETADWIRRG